MEGYFTVLRTSKVPRTRLQYTLPLGSSGLHVLTKSTLPYFESSFTKNVFTGLGSFSFFPLYTRDQEKGRGVCSIPLSKDQTCVHRIILRRRLTTFSPLPFVLPVSYSGSREGISSVFLLLRGTRDFSVSVSQPSFRSSRTMGVSG